MTFDDAEPLIKRGDVLSLRHSLETGLDPNLSNKLGWTLLMLAAMKNGDTSVGSLLLDHGAVLDVRNKFGETALSLAAHTGHHSFVKLLLDHGASLDGHPFGSSMESFLDWAEQYGTGSQEAMLKTREVVRNARSKSARTRPE
jgi:ankyrin repeat protein